MSRTGDDDMSGDDSLHSAAEHIFGLLGDDSPSDDGPEDDQEGAQDPEEVEYEEDEEELVPEDDADDESEPDADDGAEDEEEDEDQEEFYTVKIAGEELQVTLDEALAGYQRQQDYSRKTQAVADQRREAEELAQQVSAQRQQYAAGLQQVQQYLQALSPEEPDWEKVQKGDAKEARRAGEYQQFAKRLEAVNREMQRVTQEQQQELAQTQQERLAAEAEKLQAAIPEWSDEDTASQEKRALVEYATKTYGYAPEELGQVTDHRPLVMLRKAMLYDRMMEDAKTPKPKRAARLKPGAPKKKTDTKTKSRNKARERLSKSGSLDDAAETIFGLLDD